MPKVTGVAAGSYIGPRLQRVLETAFAGGRAAQGRIRQHRAPPDRHRLRAGDRDRRSLRASGATRDAIYQAMVEVRGSQRVTDQNPEDKYQALERYGRDLTDEARKGKLDPVIGRDEEIRRVIQVLRRRTKNNPVLIGEPGVGKTAIVEGLAQRIVNRRRAGIAQEQAGHVARPGRPGGRHQVPRRVRGPAQGGPSRRSRRPRARSFCSSTSCTPSSARARRRARWTRPTCSSRCSRAAS